MKNTLKILQNTFFDVYLQKQTHTTGKSNKFLKELTQWKRESQYQTSRIR